MVGDPCTSDGACGAGRVCFLAGTCRAGSSTVCWPQGYCSKVCTSTANCDPNSSCSPYVVAGSSRCLENCVFDGGVGDCRPGYVCDRGQIAASTQATCIFACAVQADCPVSTQCQSGFCCGKTGYKCCAGNTCAGGGTCANGYCQ